MAMTWKTPGWCGRWAISTAAAYPISGSLQRMPWRLIPTAAVQVSMHPTEGLPATVADPPARAGQGDRRAQGRWLLPGDGGGTGVLPARPETRPQRPPATSARHGRRPPRVRPRSMACASWSRSSRFSPTFTAPANCKASRRARQFPNTRRARSKSPSNTAPMPCKRWTKRCATNAWSKAWRTSTG